MRFFALPINLEGGRTELRTLRRCRLFRQRLRQAEYHRSALLQASTKAEASFSGGARNADSLHAGESAFGKGDPHWIGARKSISLRRVRLHALVAERKTVVGFWQLHILYLYYLLLYRYSYVLVQIWIWSWRGTRSRGAHGKLHPWRRPRQAMASSEKNMNCSSFIH